mgnify:CR=1
EILITHEHIIQFPIPVRKLITKLLTVS